MGVDILLINGYRTGDPYLPVGLGFVAQSIESAGFKYGICDINVDDEDAIINSVLSNMPAYVGIGSMTYGVGENYDMLERIKLNAPDVLIIMGGPHVIAAGKEVFDECNAVDLVVFGEGEASVPDILRGKPASDIPGVRYRGQVGDSLPWVPMDVNSIDFPRYSNFDLSYYGDRMTLSSSRGCHYNCLFCGAPKFLGRKWRAFSTSRIIDEFVYWFERGYRRFYFSDSLFLADKDRIANFCDFVVADEMYKTARFTADGIRCDHVDRMILAKMKDAGFTDLNFGVESVNDDTLRFFHKGLKFSQVDSALKIADDLGFVITLYLIIGAPTESIDMARKSILYPLKYVNVANVVFSELLPIKGTPYYDYLVNRGIDLSAYGYYPQINVYQVNDFSSDLDVWNSLQREISAMSDFLQVRSALVSLFKKVGISQMSTPFMNGMTRIVRLLRLREIVKCCVLMPARWCKVFGLAISVKM